MLRSREFAAAAGRHEAAVLPEMRPAGNGRLPAPQAFAIQPRQVKAA